MNATFRLDGCNTLRIGNGLFLPDQEGNDGTSTMNRYASRDTVVLLNEYQGCGGLEPSMPLPPLKVTIIGTLKPSAARAIGSAILSAAQDAKDRD
jgi:hypothetical protein